MRIDVTFYRRGSNREMGNENNGSESTNSNSGNGQVGTSNESSADSVNVSVTDTNGDVGTSNAEYFHLKIPKSIAHTIIATLILALIGATGTVFVNAVFTIPDKLEDIREDMKKETESDKEKFDGIDDSISDINTRLRGVENAYSASTGKILASAKNGFPTYTITTEGIKAMTASYQIEEVVSDVGLKCEANTEIAIDSSTKKKKTAKSLAETGIILPYEEDGKEVYFLGQFNKNYHWHGQCLLNVYDGNNLIQITEAVYDDGNLVKYRQVFEYKDKDTWVLSDRTHTGDVNTGTSISYYKEKGKPEYYTKTFSMGSVKGSDILNVDDFVKMYCITQEGFYCGNTSNGKYNDKTGNAYLVKYNRDGFVRLFYHGNMKKGYQYDKSGNAWDIVLGKDNKYYYRKAKYDGINNKDDVIIYSTMTEHVDGMSGKKAKKQFKKKIGKTEVECELKWK